MHNILFDKLVDYYDMKYHQYKKNPCLKLSHKFTSSLMCQFFNQTYIWWKPAPCITELQCQIMFNRVKSSLLRSTIITWSRTCYLSQSHMHHKVIKLAHARRLASIVHWHEEIRNVLSMHLWTINTNNLFLLNYLWEILYRYYLAVASVGCQNKIGHGEGGRKWMNVQVRGTHLSPCMTLRVLSWFFFLTHSQPATGRA